MNDFLSKLRRTIKIWASDSSESRALHAKEGNKHVIAFDSLRVIIVQDSKDTWFAQAIDIDYAASGLSLEDVKHNFAKGLALTLAANLKRFGNIDRVMSNPKSIDIEVLKDYTNEDGLLNSITMEHVSTCELRGFDEFKEHMPYHSISFIEGSKVLS